MPLIVPVKLQGLLIAIQHVQQRLEHSVSLPSQGDLMRAATFAPDIWETAVCRLGLEGLKFILNAATILLWKIKTSDVS